MTQFTSEAMSVIFLTLTAGSILYVFIQLLGVAHKNGRKELLYWGVLLGLARSRRHLFWRAETAAYARRASLAR